MTSSCLTAGSLAFGAAILGLLGSAGPAAAQATQPSSRTEITTFDGWAVTCRTPDGGKRACSAQLVITQTDDATKAVVPVFGWVFGLREGKVVGVFQLPTGVLIQPGVDVQIGKETRKLVYSQCAPNGCEAIVPMEDAFNKAVAAVPTVDATIVMLDGRGVKFSINMKGFDRALAEVRKQ